MLDDVQWQMKIFHHFFLEKIFTNVYTVVAIIDKFEDLWCKNYKTLIVNHEKISEKLVHKMKRIPRRE